MDSFHHAMPRILDVNGTCLGTGWLPGPPDMRDYHVGYEPDKILQAFGLQAPTTEKKPQSNVDLTRWCSRVETQGALGSCTAHALTYAVEYYQNRIYNKHVHGSRLFVYKMARWLAGLTGDTGAYLRHTMAALKMFGVCPEKFWGYTTNQDPKRGRTFDDMPPAPAFALADNYEGLKYVRHDPIHMDPKAVLDSIRLYLARGVPCVLGFYGFPSLQKGNVPGAIPFPRKDERAMFAHAVMIAGYDDAQVIWNEDDARATKTIGAFKVLNSWGTGWGANGFGWLPYQYILRRLASDVWSIIKMEWADMAQYD